MKRLLCFLPVLFLVLLAPLGAWQEEKKPIQRGTGYVPPAPEVRRAAYALDRIRNGGRVAMATKMAAPPAKFDAVEMGWIPPIEDQGNCGSCYGVATADQLTAVFVKAGYGKNDGSFAIRFQYGLDCHSSFGGCNGGWGWEVAEFMRDRGFPAEYYIDSTGNKIVDYPPYEARPRTCRTKAGAKMWKPAEIGYCSGSSSRAATVLEIKSCVMTYGIVNIAFNANNAYSNAGTNVVTVKGGANHETTLVGWDDDKKAWKTRGNWGTGLGDNGYVWMSWTSDIEDPFWMSAVALPPPPPPPDPPDPPLPPGPGPSPGFMTFNIAKDLKAGSYTWQLVPQGYETVPAGTLAELQRTKALLDNIFGRKDDEGAATKKKIEAKPMIETPEPPIEEGALFDVPGSPKSPQVIPIQEKVTLPEPKNKNPKVKYTPKEEQSYVPQVRSRLGVPQAGQGSLQCDWQAT